MSGQRGNIIVVPTDRPSRAVGCRPFGRRQVARSMEVTPPIRLAPGTSYAPGPIRDPPPLPRVASPLHEIVTAVRNAVSDAPAITELRVRGEVGAELVRAAEQGELLVLGHIPHGRSTEFLFGRVIAECLWRVRCPVVLVPA
jgi:nucleotide-binding universal stress UspA family protein